jgi:hypothetical protein
VGFQPNSLSNTRRSLRAYLEFVACASNLRAKACQLDVVLHAR